MIQVLLVLTAFASIPKSSISKEDILSALRKSEPARIQYFQKRSQDLEKIIFSDSHTFQYRWMAFATLAKVAPSEKVFERALLSNEWFLRDVALKASLEVFPKQAILWNRRAVKDVALVVRTTAVKNLKRLQDEESVELLWEELHAKRNFRKTQGLWIRKHILDSIVALLPAAKAQEQVWQSRLLQVLETDDESLQPFAFTYLKQNHPTGPSFVKDEPISIQRKRWLAYLEQQVR